MGTFRLSYYSYANFILDTLLDLHAKLSTVVRYYDRMLEERLSKAYSQHGIGGYSLPPQRQPSGPYPSIHPTASASAGPAENFYTADPRSEYNRTPTAHTYAQPAAQAPYGNYDKRGSISSTGQYPQPQPQRADSWQSQTPGPVQYSTPANYPSAEPSPPTARPRRASTQAQASRAPELGGPSAPDPNAAYYYNNLQHNADNQAPSGPPEAAPSPYPSLQQSTNYTQQSIPPTPASVSAQPSQPSHPQQYQPPAQHAQQPYWQQQQQQPPPQQVAQQHTGHDPQAYQTGTSGYAGFSQDSFPSAPQHAPPQPVVEESLIDL